MRLADRLWHDEGIGFRLLRAGLEPAAWAFAAAGTIRSLLYDRQLLPVARAGVPVVSVGNLSVGGSGKTPLVMWLADRLSALGFRSTIVSRGYGGERMTTVIATASEPTRRTIEGVDEELHVIDTSSERPTVHWRRAADEALLVALRTGCPVVTAVDRARACRIAELAFAPDVILLDDGFQHRSLARTLDIVVVGEHDRAARLLPAGPLRELPAALRRADVVVSRDESVDGPRLVRRPLGLVSSPSRTAAVEPLASLGGRRVLAVAGIANPEEFLAMLGDAGAEVARHVLLSDHHRYRAADLQAIGKAAAGLDRIVTTEKDLVKLMTFEDRPEPLVALRLGVEVTGAESLIDLVVARCELDAKARGPHHRGLRTRR